VKIFEFAVSETVEIEGRGAKKELDKTIAESVDSPPLLIYEKQSVNDDTTGAAGH
jgi:hypothetical protein